jgi:hypothetical protein
LNSVKNRRGEINIHVTRVLSLRTFQTYCLICVKSGMRNLHVSLTASEFRVSLRRGVRTILVSVNGVNFTRKNM